MVGALRVTFAALRILTVDSHPAAFRARTPTDTSPSWLVKDMRSATPDKLELPLNRVRGEATAPFADSVTNLKVRVTFPPPSSVHPCVTKWNLVIPATPVVGDDVTKPPKGHPAVAIRSSA